MSFTAANTAVSILARRITNDAPRTARRAGGALGRCQQRRAMGGGGGGGQPESQSMKARLWEEDPEGWEGTIYATYGAAIAIIGTMVLFSPDTTIKTWANNEAKARLDLLRSGSIDKVEFGVHYNTPEKLGWEEDWDKFAEKSIRPGEDDDDDDDDDDDEEEEEDEEEGGGGGDDDDDDDDNDDEDD